MESVGDFVKLHSRSLVEMKINRDAIETSLAADTVALRPIILIEYLQNCFPDSVILGEKISPDGALDLRCFGSKYSK